MWFLGGSRLGQVPLRSSAFLREFAEITASRNERDAAVESV